MSDIDLSRLLTVDDFEQVARERLTQVAYDYFRTGSDAEETLAENRAAFRRWQLWPRVLVGVAERALATTVLGAPLAHPIAIAPTATQQLAHPDGEAATARAAAASGALLVVSLLSSLSLEEVAAAAPGPKWLQLYIHRDRGLVRSFVERAAAAGYRALCVTVDTPVLARRLLDERNGSALGGGQQQANYAREVAAAAVGGTHRFFAARHDPSLSWRDLAWLRSLSSLPLVLKGVLRADDAARAVDEGADAIVVSNHGGRQLDGAPATIDALAGVVDAVGGRVEVLVDGGFRWGGDVVKALALGARAILVGRPVLWGLAAGGQAGVERVLGLLRDDLSRAMALCGCPDVASIDRSLVQARKH